MADQNVALVVSLPRANAGWELREGEWKVAQGEHHSAPLDLLLALLRYWAKQRGARIVHDMALRWVEEDRRIGVNPDISVLLPNPPVPDGELHVSYCTWISGHEPPILAIEIVSESNSEKDYSIAPEKYAASGTKELVVFDPILFGPRNFGGPYRLQLWRRTEQGKFERLYAGEGPVFSPALGAWLVATHDSRKLRIANDAALTDFWLTEAESERAAKEAERAAKDAALLRVAELEAELARRGK